MSYEELKDRYLNDPEFYHLCKFLESMIYKNNFTPYELKQAAFFASLKFQMENVDKVNLL